MQGDTLLQHNIQIDVEIDPSLRRVTLSHNQLLQALVNGVKNAYESIRLRQLQEPVAGLIRLRAVHLGENRMRLSIEDNGAGIAPEQRADLFRFGYSTKARGSGFGLHSTALFVQEMGGSIALNSDGPNLGACLVLELPCGNVEANLRSSN
jgi:signal transduction histidine kinase